MKLVAAVSEGSGLNNEDACGFIERDGEVVAGWVFDGITGINGANYLSAGTDAQWIVGRAELHLRDLAASNLALSEILGRLVERLMADWAVASCGVSLPDGYDPPGSCLILAKRYADSWHALRLGDCTIITRSTEVKNFARPATAFDQLEAKLKRCSDRLRARGPLEFEALLQELKPQVLESRKARNTNDGISVLVAGPEALAKPEYLDLGKPDALLLCTDGFYRAVDHYALFDDQGLVGALLEPTGAAQILERIRAAERSDFECRKYPRFKPADDATALVLRST